MKKLFKIKGKMFYIDRSHISKRARGTAMVALQITQLTPDSIASDASPRAVRALAPVITSHVRSRGTS